jgi:hypothetical protein
MGQDYGMLPTDIMRRPAWDFWMNARVRAAGKTWEAYQRRNAQQSGSAGAATDGERQDLAEQQDARADQREQQDGQPSLNDQLAALQEANNGGDGSQPGSGGR